MFPRIHAPGTPQLSLQAGWKGRSQAASDKLEAHRDPVKMAVTAVRTRIRALGEAGNIARAEFAANHASVACPLPTQVHPDVAEILSRFLVASGLDGADLLAPLKAHESVEAIADRHTKRLQADLDMAKAELVRVERQEALDRLEEAQKALADVEAQHNRPLPEPVEDEAPVEVPMPVPTLDQVHKALAEQEPVIPGAEDAPKRRGRPRKGMFVDISDLPSD